MSGTDAPFDDADVGRGRLAWLRAATRARFRRARTRTTRSLLRGRFAIVITLVMLLMIAVFLVPLSIIFIGPGDGGVLWRRFDGGTVFGPALGEGYHIVWPWDRVYIYDLRLQYWHEDIYALSSDGLSLSVGVAVRYRLSPDNLAYLQESVGPDYVAKVIKPQVAAVVRELVALYPMESLLGPLRNQVQKAIYKAVTDRSHLNAIGALDASTGADANRPGRPPTAASGPKVAGVSGHVNTRVNTLNRPLILLQDLLISRIVIPKPVRAAINAKLRQSERVQEYAYRLSIERYEAELKVVQAEGIRRFENTVAPGITKGYLKLRGIEATEALARSPNTKIIVIGGSNGLPLILNTGNGVARPGSAVPVAPPLPPATSPMQPSPQPANTPLPTNLPPARPAPAAVPPRPAGVPAGATP